MSLTKRERLALEEFAVWERRSQYIKETYKLSPASSEELLQLYLDAATAISKKYKLFDPAVAMWTLINKLDKREQSEFGLLA